MIGRTIGKCRIIGQVGRGGAAVVYKVLDETLNRDGVLREIGGAFAHVEYHLAAHTSLIGRSNTALVRLRGWCGNRPCVHVERWLQPSHRL